MAGRRHANGDRPNDVEGVDIAEAMEGEKSFSQKLRRVDSLHLEAGRVSNSQTHGTKVYSFFSFHQENIFCKKKCMSLASIRLG